MEASTMATGITISSSQYHSNSDNAAAARRAGTSGPRGFARVQFGSLSSDHMAAREKPSAS
jgi:hypothetical protein